jgi:glycosyltransferase involved in cell wall biosynthesis
LDNGRCGLTAAPGNVQQVADALESLLGDRAMRERLGLLAHARAREKYDTAAALPLFLAAYERAIERFRNKKSCGNPAKQDVAA